MIYCDHGQEYWGCIKSRKSFDKLMPVGLEVFCSVVWVRYWTRSLSQVYAYKQHKSLRHIFSVFYTLDMISINFIWWQNYVLLLFWLGDGVSILCCLKMLLMCSTQKWTERYGEILSDLWKIVILKPSNTDPVSCSVAYCHVFIIQTWIN